MFPIIICLEVAIFLIVDARLKFDTAGASCEDPPALGGPVAAGNAGNASGWNAYASGVGSATAAAVLCRARAPLAASSVSAVLADWSSDATFGRASTMSKRLIGLRP